MSSIFVSHSSKDDEAARHTAARLKTQGYESVFRDFDPNGGIPAGRDWGRKLYHNLRICRALIVLCRDHSMASRGSSRRSRRLKRSARISFP